ncbi:PQQ-dependent sugar dehydrogenase [Edaphovirga cremea]|uniref:PQQ-dependent sugar dehydrogenase n=1 Tax=Edaphovirga cremea TaxID=2267246 RepID=UPI000DEFDA26
MNRCGFIIAFPLIFSALAVALPAHAVDPQVTELLDKLDHPWSMEFLPDNQGLLITERSGQLRVWKEGKGLSAPITGVPEVYNSGQGGLLEVLLAPDFATSRKIYLTFAEAEQGSGKSKAGTALGVGRLTPDNRSIENFQVIFRQEPKLSVGNHFGGKLAFDKQGNLFMTLGENNQRPTAQELNKLQGKVVRLTPEGKPVADNPFINNANARPEIWSYGHRNPQGLALNPWTGVMWENEHGPRGGDEINIPQAGKNYGWPLATWGINYSGLPIPEAKGTKVAGTEQPIHYWERSPGVSGMAFYNSDRFPVWKHSLFIGALAQENLIHLKLDGDKIVSEERWLGDRKERIRDVRVGPDGYVYLLTDDSDGKLLRLQPQQ